MLFFHILLSWYDYSCRFYYYILNNKYDLRGDFELADRYFKACLDSHDQDEFMLNAGRLMHLMAHIMPVKRGNASIMEWTIRALAKEKDIELGPFSFDDKIAWDMKALVTPNREAYAIWFKDRAYQFVKSQFPSQGSRP